MTGASLVDRVAALMGYTRMPHSMTTMHPDSVPAPAEPSLPPHLTHEAAFDFDSAANDQDWAFTQHSDKAFFWAVGKRDWMPVLLAGFCLGGYSQKGTALFSEAIESRMWLRTSSPAHESWLAANKSSFEEISGIEQRGCITGTEWEGAPVFTEAMFADLPPLLVSHELRTMWRRRYPGSSLQILATTRAHNLLVQTPAMREAYMAADHALKLLVGMTATWLQSHGLEVAKDTMLVAVKGYEPLFHYDDDPAPF